MLASVVQVLQVDISSPDQLQTLLCGNYRQISRKLYAQLLLTE